jgi:murein DD-endopeptidase MepM/ murein hydrolase activator NlpD
MTPTYHKYNIEDYSEKKRNAGPVWILAGAVGLILVLLIVALIVRRTRPAGAAAVRPAQKPAADALPVPVGPALPWAAMVFPTGQDILGNTGKEFQPTAMGKPESALYGSTRTGANGAAFHEGVDIAPMKRDARGRVVDTVRAVADGTVVYANRVGGNSTYGKYVVVVHRDPLGEVYTLYAHLAQVDEGSRPGAAVQPGTPLGVMGNTSSFQSSFLPHLHLEFGLMVNRHFDGWFRAQNLKPDHGTYHGYNLLAINPLSVYEAFKQRPDLDMGAHLKSIPVAFQMAVRMKRTPDFFARYPSLWKGAQQIGEEVVVLDCSENGLPLSGRLATDEETGAMGRDRVKVLAVNEEALGRNGAHIITGSAGSWRLHARSGQRWLDILTYEPGGSLSFASGAKPATASKKTVKAVSSKKKKHR